jgi:hypothetical protein
LESAHIAQLAEIDALFASLEYRAFRGELWTDNPALALRNIQAVHVHERNQCEQLLVP